MALIGKIRENTWILFVLVGLGTIGFIATSGQSGGGGLGGNPNVMAEIDGRKLTIQEFTNAEQILYGGGGGNTFSNRNFLWNYYVDEAVMNNEAEDLGIGVSNEELQELQFGQNLSPIIEQRFRNPSTFQVDRERLNEFRTLIEQGQLTDPRQRAYWAHQEEEIITDRLKRKVGEVAAKSVYAPNWMIEMVNKERNEKVDFEYVQIPFAEVDNSEVTVTDTDLKAYITANAAKYESDEETRVIDYVVFEVEPTAEDIEKIRQDMVEIKGEFETTENDTLFLENYYSSFEPAYVKKADLDAAIADTVFSLPIGSVYGPYEQNDAFNLVKVIDRKVLPDSVRSRHILLRYEQNQQSFNQAFTTADSLRNLIEAGTETFDSLAAKFGTDGTASKGGDLGFAAPGAMVKPFNDLIFYDAEYDSIYLINTQFGLHLVEVLERKYETGAEGVRVGYVKEAIVPSDVTQNAIYTEALQFAGNNRSLDAMKAAATADPALEVLSSAKKNANDFSINPTALKSNETSREIIKWGFGEDIEVGDVSSNAYAYQNPENFYIEKYVVAGLSNIQAPGVPTIENVRDEIEQEVYNEKKAALIKSKVRGQELNAIAREYNTNVDTASNATFNSGFIPGLGNEPVVVAKAFQLEVGQTSDPILGRNGVYVIKVLNKPKDVTPANIANLRKSIASQIRTTARSQVAQELRKQAKIKDNRSRFY